MCHLQGFLLIILLSFLLNGCSNRDRPAPVSELAYHPWSIHDKTANVRKGDTLFAIAFKYDKDYRELMRINHLPAHHPLKEGQTIKLVEDSSNRNQMAMYPTPRRPVIAKKHVKIVKKSSITKNTYKKTIVPLKHENKKNQWIWPLKGTIADGFYPAQGKKGINIAGKKDEPVKAATDGIVAYAGNGLSGYGNLIIIKHQSNILTAYGNNQSLLVHEGQKVVAGQVIAKAGMIDKRYFGVHFEVRKSGTPVNPMIYLNKG